jgi:Phytanoyl-CoA dioxygenase (PhyH)
VAEDIRDRFHRDGYAVVRSVISAAEVAALRARLLPVFRPEQNGGKKVHTIVDTALEDPGILDVLRRPALVEALTAVLGEGFVVPPHSSVSWELYGVFHTDTTGAEMSGQTFHKDPSFRMVTVAIYLQDNDQYGGGIRLAAGTHTQPDRYVALTRRKARIREQLRTSAVRRRLRQLSGGRLYDYERDYEHPAGRDIVEPAGTAIFWDMRLVHRASHPTVKTAPPDGGKIVMFFTCGASNPVTTDAYMKYMRSVPENAYLLRPRRLPDPASAPREFVLL